MNNLNIIIDYIINLLSYIVIYNIINMPPKGLVKGSQEMRDYMKSLRDKRGNKKGKGMMKDLYEKGKDILIEEGRNQLSNVVDKGADIIKRKIRGKGLLGNIGRAVSGTLIDALPGPNIIKTGLKYGTNKLIDQTGMGLKIKNSNKKIKNSNKKIVGGALYPSGY